MSGRPHAAAMVCPVMIGREAEVAELTAALDAASAGHGRVVGLIGDAGVGKSRAARVVGDLASARGMDVVVGRGVPSGSDLPHRPLIDAFATRFRDRPRPTDPALRGFEGHLARLVPQWGHELTGGADESALLLGEAVVRLLRLGGPSALLLEDLHWADSETANVVEYLADALDGVPLLVVVTSRPEGRVHDDLTRAARNGPTTILRLDVLDAEAVEAMVTACLGATAPPPLGLAAWIAERSDGLPFVVEELLAGLVADGSLTHTDTGWVVAGDLTASVPLDLASSISARLERLSSRDRWILAAAALLGRRFAWEVLPGVADVDGRSVLEAMRSAIDAQLIEADGDGFTFRHALTRDAIVAGLLPPERKMLAERALEAVELAHPGLPGPTRELAADLAELAGRSARAAAHLVESARRALDAGAFHTAETTARRAGRLARRSATAVDGEEDAGSAGAVLAEAVLAHVLAESGKPIEALAIGRPLVGHLDDGEAAELRLVLTRAALAAGQPDLAEELSSAVGESSNVTSPADQPRIDAVRAHVALARDRVDDAVELSRRALEGALATDQPAVACEALEVLGRLAPDPAIGIAHLQRAADLAEASGLAVWQLRSRHEIALMRWGEGDVSALRETRDYAASVGALVTQAVMDLSLADVAFAAFDGPACEAAASTCIQASRRFGLATEPVAHLWLAGAHALAGDREGVARHAADALAHDRDDPRILGDLEGRVRATLAVVDDDLPAMRRHLDSMMDHVRRAPATTSVFPGRAWWAVVHAMDDEDQGRAALDESLRWSETYPMWPIRLQVGLVEAVMRGRMGESDRAGALVEEVREVLRTAPPGLGIATTQVLLVSIAAIRDGWGEPAAWLRECESFYVERDLDRVARRCRVLIGESGAPVPRRRTAGVSVPASLRSLGVTGREYQVLQLLTEGLGNREIADRLVISPRTVDRHVENLFARTGVHDRGSLADLSRRHQPENG